MRVVTVVTRNLCRTYTVKSELDFRQMFHYCESQYRDLISAGVPFEGQSFGMDVYAIGYQSKKPVASNIDSDTVGEVTDGESDLDEVGQRARFPWFWGSGFGGERPSADCERGPRIRRNMVTLLALDHCRRSSTTRLRHPRSLSEETMTTRAAAGHSFPATLNRLHPPAGTSS